MCVCDALGGGGEEVKAGRGGAPERSVKLGYLVRAARLSVLSRLRFGCRVSFFDRVDILLCDRDRFLSAV